MATPSWTKKCANCGEEISRYPGTYGVSCSCGAEYNVSGQRLRDDWASNPSAHDDEIGDMEGYELSQLANEE